MVKITDDYMDPVQRQAFQASGIKVPNFAQAELYQPTHNAPVWLHFGGGNIFRVTHADIMQRLIEQGLTDQGIIDVDTFSEDLVLKIYRPFKNRTLSVTLEPQGTEKKLIVTVTEALTVAKRDPTDLARLKEIFRAPSLQLVTFTITEKGYALTDLDGNYLPMIQSDRDSGPETVQSAMGYVTMGLFERWQAGQYPLALVSTDNFSHNGEVLKQSIWDIASAWVEKGYADPKFLDYLNSESTISFPITVIDKITPNPDPDVAHELEKSGYEDYQLVPSPRGVNLATFVNAEATEYLVIEDKFPNGRPALEKAGVYFGDVEMIDKFERMKVCTCLNPLHTALAVLGCLLGYTKIYEEMNDPDLANFIRNMAYQESMKVVSDPGIIKPETFLEECLTKRFPNPYLPDTPQRIATDTSQKLPIRFGVTLAEYVSSPNLNVTELVYIPFVFSAWLRYLTGLDDQGQLFEISPDPLLDSLKQYSDALELGNPQSAQLDQLAALLSDSKIFGVDLVEIGLAEKVVEQLQKLLSGPGAVRSVLQNLIQQN